jgi:hypothetical protein
LTAPAYWKFESSGESTNHRFLGGGAASAVCHRDVLGAAAGDEITVYDRFLVEDFRAGVSQVGLFAVVFEAAATYHRLGLSNGDRASARRHSS